MKNFIKRIDILGGDVSLFYKGEKGVRTLFGGLITIFVGFILVLLIIGFGQNFYKRINPLVVIQDLYPNYYNHYNISNSNFPISFRYENSDGKQLEIEEKSFYFDITHDRYIRRDGSLELVSRVGIPYKKCVKSEFDNDMLYDKLGLNKSLCFDFGEKGYFEFGGYWDGEFVDYIYINSLKCKEGSTNKKGIACASEKETQALISNLLYVSVYIPNILIDPSEYTNPFTLTLINLYSMLDLNIVKNTYLKFIEIQMFSDIGWLIQDIKEHKEISYYQTTTDYSLQSSLAYDEYYSNYYSSVTLYMVKNIKKYTRVYTKIQNLAAEVGGILKLFTSIMSILIHFYNNSYFEFELIKVLNNYLTTTKESPSNSIKINKSNYDKANNVSNLSNLNQSSFLNINKSNINTKDKSSLKNAEEINVRLVQIENRLMVIKRIHDELNKKHTSLDRKSEIAQSLKHYILSKICIYSKSDLKNNTNRMKNHIKEYLDIESIMINVVKQKRFNRVFFDNEESNFYLK